MKIRRYNEFCLQEKPSRALKIQKNRWVAGAPPQTPLGELTAIPIPPSWWGGGWLPLPKNPTPTFGPSGLRRCGLSSTPPTLKTLA